MVLSGWGASKLLLFGEHAAVYGYPAVGVALPDGVRLHIRPGAGPVGSDARGVGTGGLGAVRSDAGRSVSGRSAASRDGGFYAHGWHFSGLPERYARILGKLMTHAEAVLRERFDARRVEELRGDMQIEATVPPAVGFGSSAAVCTALAKALLPALSPQTPSPHEVWRLAHELEVFFHGSPSGIDTGIANLGGIQAFTFEGGGLPRARSLTSPDLYLLVGAVPRHDDTKHLVARVKAAHESGAKPVRCALDRLGSIAEEAIELLGHTDSARVVQRLGGLAEEAHERLSELDLSNRDLESVLSAGRQAGAVGGKLSGAGGGGAFYLLVADEEVLARAEAAVRRVLGGIGGDLPLFSYRVVAGDAERVSPAA